MSFRENDLDDGVVSYDDDDEDQIVEITNPEHNVIYEFKGTQFMWDSVKYERNYEKHKIAFEEAATVILDPDTKYFPDEKHSGDEERTIAVGFSDKLRILMVCHCLRKRNTVVRIISARKATKLER